MAEQVLDDVERVLDPGADLDSALSTGSAKSRSPLGNALMMLRLIAMLQDTARSACSGRLSAPV